MSTYKDIRLSRQLAWTGVGLGYAIAVAIAILNLASDDGSALSAAAFLTLLALPSTMAVFAMDRRPSLMTAATMAAVIQGVLLLASGVGFLNFVVAMLWFFAGQRRPRPAPAPSWATWARPLLAFAAAIPLVVLFLHQDPRCTITAPDGSVTIVEATGYEAGWRLSLGSSGTSTTGEGGTRSCSSDTVQDWEAVISILVSLGIVGLAWRWPVSLRDEESITTRSGSL